MGADLGLAVRHVCLVFRRLPFYKLKVTSQAGLSPFLCVLGPAETDTHTGFAPLKWYCPLDALCVLPGPDDVSRPVEHRVLLPSSGSGIVGRKLVY